MTLRQHRRETLRKRQSEIAELAKVSQTTLSKIENGHMPEPWDRARIARAYRLSLIDFQKMVNKARKRNEA